MYVCLVASFDAPKFVLSSDFAGRSFNGGGVLMLVAPATVVRKNPSRTKAIFFVARNMKTQSLKLPIVIYDDL